MIKVFIHITLVLAGITNVIPALCQYKFDYTWVMGVEQSNLYTQNEFNFHADTLKVKDSFLNFAFYRMNSSISDQDGNLLLYFNGCDIANGKHEILEYGSGFNEGITGNWECPKNNGYPGAFQSALILPHPGFENTYIIFHVNDFFTSLSIESSLLYSIAEIENEFQSGKVLVKNNHALKDSFVTSAGLTAVKHINNVDWWVILARKYGGKYARMLLTKDGIIEYPDIEIGFDSLQYGGQTCFSPDGTKYMRYTSEGLTIMDYDRSDGLFYKHRFLPIVPSGVFIGGTFSPNGRFVYLSNYSKIYQVDTWEEELSLDLVAEWDGTKSGVFDVLFGMMQTGPDCRIYVSSLNCLPFVHIIMNPDEKGAGCNVVQRAIKLNASYCGFPNFPNFRLGTPYPYCDPDKVVVTSTHHPVEINPTEPQIFPNPTMQDFTIRTSEIIEYIEVYNIHGHRVFQQKPYLNEIKVSVQDWPSGVYFVDIKYKGSHRHLVRKIVVMP